MTHVGKKLALGLIGLFCFSGAVPGKFGRFFQVPVCLLELLVLALKVFHCLRQFFEKVDIPVPNLE